MLLTALVAVWLLSIRGQLPELFLLAALGVGLAGGSFAVGIAYVSKLVPEKEKSGHGAGHLRHGQCRCRGDQVSGAPFLLVAFGWVQTVAQMVWPSCAGW